MPTYLLHGFRWPRALIRIHIILQNLEDAAAEWLMAPGTVETMVSNFNTCYPKPMASLPNLQFIEQYDPMDERPESRLQPYAYVADVVHEVKLGVDLAEIIGKSLEPTSTIEPLTELRKQLAGDHEIPSISWYIVVCGDTERPAPVDRPDLAQSSTPVCNYPSTTDLGSTTRSGFQQNGPNGQENEGNGKYGTKKRTSLQKLGDSGARSGLSSLILRMRKPSRKSLVSNSSQLETGPESLCPS